MTEVYIGGGSNVEPRRHLRAALAGLAESFGVLRVSPVYRNKAVGFDGDDFLNMVVGFDTDLGIAEVAAELDRMEVLGGRVRDGVRFGPRTLDLDLLLFGDKVLEHQGIKVPRDEITRYAFVLRPLADIAGDRKHPLSGRSFAELWADFDHSEHDLETVDFFWVSE
ncbi:MAG: 2-amino-4-hydroxy-6-hydroxymethyldihydropteridine diphosphokinase [Gammaproteobacteria bacterium]